MTSKPSGCATTSVTACCDNKGSRGLSYQLPLPNQAQFSPQDLRLKGPPSSHHSAGQALGYERLDSPYARGGMLWQASGVVGEILSLRLTLCRSGQLTQLPRTMERFAKPWQWQILQLSEFPTPPRMSNFAVQKRAHNSHIKPVACHLFP